MKRKKRPGTLFLELILLCSILVYAFAEIFFTMNVEQRYERERRAWEDLRRATVALEFFMEEHSGNPPATMDVLFSQGYLLDPKPSFGNWLYLPGGIVMHPGFALVDPEGRILIDRKGVVMAKRSGAWKHHLLVSPRASWFDISELASFPIAMIRSTTGHPARQTAEGLIFETNEGYVLVRWTGEIQIETIAIQPEETLLEVFSDHGTLCAVIGGKTVDDLPFVSVFRFTNGLREEIVRKDGPWLDFRMHASGFPILPGNQLFFNGTLHDISDMVERRIVLSNTTILSQGEMPLSAGQTDIGKLFVGDGTFHYYLALHNSKQMLWRVKTGSTEEVGIPVPEDAVLLPSLPCESGNVFLRSDETLFLLNASDSRLVKIAAGHDFLGERNGDIFFGVLDNATYRIFKAVPKYKGE